jgi:hypothetical protein
MLVDYIINLHIPVIIYIVSCTIILFIQSFFIISKKKLVKYMIIVIVASIFLQFLCNVNFRKTAWFIVLSPFIAITLLFCSTIYLMLFYDKSGRTFGQKLNNLKSILQMCWKIRQDNRITVFNEMRTLTNI